MVKRLIAPIALVAIFALPVAAAWWFMMNPSSLPVRRANHGTLVQPPLPTELKGSWTLLVPRERCDAPCRQAKSVASVVHRALGADGTRVKVVSECEGGERGACATVASALGDAALLVIIDPAGNAMMRYGAEVTPRDLLQDLQRLLKASSYWRRDGAR